MEAPIVSGLKRPVKGKLVAGAEAGQHAAAGGASAWLVVLRAAAARLAILSVAAAGRIGRRLGRVTRWAAARSLAPNSLTGVSLLLALCAAAWFSGGQADMDKGAIALSGSLLTMVGARRLAAFIDRPGEAAPRPTMRAARAPDGSSDWLVLPGLAWEEDGPADDASGGAWPGRAAGHSFSWLFAVCAVAAEGAVYGGIAAGGQSAGLKNMWLLAVLAVTSAAVADLAGTCRGGIAGASADARPGRSRAMWQAADKVLAPPAWARVILAMGGLVVFGPWLALVAVIAVEALSICCTVAMLVVIGPGEPDVVLACRDDGPVARWAGRLVRGNLVPLPPALAGAVATALLAALGLRNLPGFIALTPPVVMMLAAPGASHPHDRRFDWLVPVLLAIGQYTYLAALGFALAVPGPAILAACALTAIWQASVAVGALADAGDRQITDASSGRPPGGGWETRMFAPGLAAILGFATFGYVGLAAYLGVLICRTVVIGYLIPREEDRQ